MNGVCVISPSDYLVAQSEIIDCSPCTTMPACPSAPRLATVAPERLAEKRVNARERAGPLLRSTELRGRGCYFPLTHSADSQPHARIHCCGRACRPAKTAGSSALRSHRRARHRQAPSCGKRVEGPGERTAVAGRGRGGCGHWPQIQISVRCASLEHWRSV